jgi:pimeloyl-ACP methyl ester carboxylesterase
MPITRFIQASLLIALVGLGAAACGNEDAPGAATPASSTTSDAPSVVRPSAPIDELIPVGDSGARLHLQCSGSGPSTVVLISGFGDGGENWGAVTPSVSAKARVCSYARFGTGTSDPPPSEQTFTSQAADLRDLLQTAGEPGPYVVVGHSSGGAEAVAFASRFADEVEGLLLLDASPIGWPAAVCGVPDDGSEATASYQQVCAAISHPDQKPEWLNATKGLAEISEIDTLGGLPMIVATRLDLSQPGLPAASQAELSRVWNEGQAHWASLSSAAELVTIPDTSHYIQVDQPATVIQEIISLLP